MSPSEPTPPNAGKALDRLFLTLFLRGRTSRGLTKDAAPKSMGQKLFLVVGLYALVGVMAIAFRGQPVFALSGYLHAMTFAFLGMFLASSAGEVMFNKEEADILLHRPVTSRDLLRAKVRVLVWASFWLAGAFNLVGLFVGLTAEGGDWRFPIVHLLSTGMQAVFCAACVVLAYQLCLRYFGRDRLDGLITSGQVVVSVGAIGCSQLLPQIMFDPKSAEMLETWSWWLVLLPPAWFAGLDDAIAGSMQTTSWAMGALAICATALVSWAAFSKLADGYESGLQQLSESSEPRKTRRPDRRGAQVIADFPVLRWYLRDPVTRASFVLSVAYLLRDRDVKLRVYPALGPFAVIPLIMIFPQMGQEERSVSTIMTGMAFGYLGVLPVMGISMMQYTQQWQASDLFRYTPLAGPAKLCDGTRLAVIVILTVPIICVTGFIVGLLLGELTQLLLIVPIIIAMPVLALLPNIGKGTIPFSLPPEEAKGTGRGLVLFGVMLASLPLSLVAALCLQFGILHWFILAEIPLAYALHTVIRKNMEGMQWPSLE